NYSVPSGYSYEIGLNVTRKVQVLAASQYFYFNVSITLPRNHLLTDDINQLWVYLRHDDVSRLFVQRTLPHRKNQLHYITDYDLISPITNGRFVVE
uniref:Uncharacterized protein n=1 Tax=Amphimedon queenslandica TaxID=400682 RepID=A0A1X7SEQ7_AMPQE